MKFYLVMALFYNLFNPSDLQAEADVEYYETIWNETIEASHDYVRPTENIEFKGFETEKCEESSDSYDFIIVGGGTAGLVLANRLSEISEWSILVLEAGGEETDFSIIPAAAFGNYLTPLNWGYLSTPQNNSCFGCVNNQCDLSQGKTLGGSSTMTAMVHVRGHKRDFDLWAAQGNSEWSYEKVLPYFRKSETARFQGDASYHGNEGPIVLIHPEPKPLFEDAILNGNKEMGYDVLDYNGERQLGVSSTQLTINGKVKGTANQDYLKPIRNRSNLKVITHALVTKINFRRNVAKSVKYLRNGICAIVKAKLEIIVTAGYINSAQLLMLSGIGPKEELAKFKIKTKVDLPVGKNMFDHVSVAMVNFISNYSMDLVPIHEEMRNYVLNGTGNLLYPPTLQLSFMSTALSEDPEWPDIEIVYGQPASYFHFGFDISKRSSNFNDEMDDVISGSRPNVLYLVFVLMRPKSYGTVTLQSSNPLDFPLINPNFFDHPDDIETVYLAINRTIQLTETEAFKKMNLTLPKIPIKKCESLEGREYWYCIIRYKSLSLYHATSTTRMGTDWRTSVVDQNLNVHKIRKLRVVGASSVPESPVAHLGSIVYMMGEKIADTIKLTYRKRI